MRPSCSLTSGRVSGINEDWQDGCQGGQTNTGTRVARTVAAASCITQRYECLGVQAWAQLFGVERGRHFSNTSRIFTHLLSVRCTEESVLFHRQYDFNPSNGLIDSIQALVPATKPCKHVHIHIHRHLHLNGTMQVYVQDDQCYYKLIDFLAFHCCKTVNTWLNHTARKPGWG